ncbi:ATP-binding protein [Bacillus daqingensis]|uniref:histidine kinase n=1 Tax=Bacillus daqingensis TaxID=872396 RepID=A0ABV9NTW6_9BACI
MRKQSLFRKLFSTYAAVILGSFLVFGAAYIIQFHYTLYDDFEQRHADIREAVKSQLQTADRYGWSSDEREESLSAVLSGSDYEAELLDSGSETASGYWTGGELHYEVVSSFDEGYIRTVFTGLEHDYIRAVTAIAGTIGGVLMLAAGMVWVVSRRLADPLREMSRAASAVSGGDFSMRVNESGPLEISRLGRSLNQMGKELAETEQLRKAFLANVTHDLRSPLTSIKGFLTALEDGTIPDERRLYYYRLMRGETERLIKLVHDLLDLTKLEGGRIELDCAPVALKPALERVLETARPELGSRRTVLTGETEAVVWGDRERLDQVWINLLANAAAFSPENSTITLTFTEHRESVSVSIRDEGSGMTKEALEQMWDRFYKADSSRSGKAGTGIGLSIVRSLTELHGGAVSADSSVGEGTTVTVTLPKA